MWTSPAHADGDVSVCDEAHLLSALSGVLILDGVTLANNVSGSGAGIANTGQITITNSTIRDNVSFDNGTGVGGNGGGNLSYPDATCPGINLDPVLGPLQDNGGPTMTAALLEESVAIDNGIDSICNAAPVNGLDQRGVVRPIGEHCDIGAYESDAAPPESNFVMDIDTPYAAMCLSESAMYEVDVLSVSGFDTPVNLSVNNLPEGTNAAFDNNPVIPTASSELTISDTGTASVGSYTIDVVGTSVTRTQSVSANLFIYDTVPDVQPTLLTPPDGITDTVLKPTFSWEPIEDAIYYQLQVAADIQFTTIVYSRTMLTTSDTPGSNLQEGTQYYWRVKASNQCGAGPYSAVFTFTTKSDDGPSTSDFNIYLPFVIKTN